MPLRRWLTGLLLCALFLVTVAGPTSADAPIATRLNGRPLFLPAAPVLQQGRILVPMRAYLEALGAQVQWGRSGEITALLDGRTVRFTSGNPMARVDDRPVMMDVPPRVVNGFTYVPLRFLSEALAAAVHYDGHTVHVTAASGGWLQVVDGPLNVRSGPGTHYAAITTVPVGTVFSVVQRGVGWDQVRLPRGRMGWVASPYTEAIGAAPATAALGHALSFGSAYVQVDGDCLGPSPVIDNTLYVPLRSTLQRAGGQMTWSEGSAAVRYGPREVVITPGRAQVEVNGVLMKADPTPLLMDGQTLVPARSLANWLGLDLVWEAASRTVHLRTGRSTAAGAVPCNPWAPLEAYLIMDAATGLVLAEYRADKRLPIASTTKIMTILLALEQGDPQSLVTASAQAAGTEGSSLYLRRGERQTLQDLLYGLMLHSANDAAVAVAEHLAGSEAAFASLMTSRAREMGALATTFRNSSGLDDRGHLSTAYDLAVMARHAMHNIDFRALAATQEYHIPGPQGGRLLKTTNQFVTTYGGATGVKNGWTDAARHTLAASAFRDGSELIVVVLGAATRGQLYQEAQRLMDYAFALNRKAWILQAARP